MNSNTDLCECGSNDKKSDMLIFDCCIYCPNCCKFIKKQYMIEHSNHCLKGVVPRNIKLEV